MRPWVAWEGGLPGRVRLRSGATAGTFASARRLLTAPLPACQRAVAGAFALVLAIHEAAPASETSEDLSPALSDAIVALSADHPGLAALTAALRRLSDCFEHHAGLLAPSESVARLLMEARRLANEQLPLHRAIAANARPLLAGRRVCAVGLPWPELLLHGAAGLVATAAPHGGAAALADGRADVLLLAADSVAADGGVLAMPGASLLLDRARALDVPVWAMASITTLVARLPPHGGAALTAGAWAGWISEIGLTSDPADLARWRDGGFETPAV